MANDAQLWEAIKADDEKAFASLFYKYSPKIFATAFKHIKDEETSQHIVNQIFVSLWNKRSTTNIVSFEAYLTTAARYHVYKAHIAKSKNKEVLQEEFNEDMASSVENMGVLNLQLADLENKIDKLLLTLPNRCREIFMMSRHRHLSNDQIAAQLGISKRTVENQITHALKHLRLFLKNASLFVLLFFSITSL